MQVAASRCQIRRSGEEAANLSTRCRPCRFSRLRRFRPQTTVWACCIPLPTMGFAWLRAEERRCRRCPDISHRRCTLRSFPLLTRWTPSPSHCWLVHRMSCPSRGWPSSVLHDRPKSIRSPEVAPTSGVFPARSPLLARRVAATGSPVAPLGFAPTLGFHPPNLLAARTGRSHPHSVRVPTEIGPLRPPDPPKRIWDTNKTVALEPSGRISCRLRGRRCDPGSRSRACGFPHAPRCRSIALAPQPSGVHRCRCAA